MDVALEALYVLGVLMCCALLSREEGSREVYFVKSVFRV